MSGAAAVIVKTPGLTPIKTRLAKHIGKEKAEQFYMLCLKDIEREMRLAEKQNPNIKPYWAVTERDSMSNPLWQEFDCIWTGLGNIASRLSTVYSYLLKKHGYAVIIAADSPEIKAATILKAVTLVAQERKTVIGPTIDGGFYMFASNIILPPEIWTETSFGTSHAREDFVEELSDITDVFQLEPLVHADNLLDMKRLKSSRFISPEMASWLAVNIV